MTIPALQQYAGHMSYMKLDMLQLTMSPSQLSGLSVHCMYQINTSVSNSYCHTSCALRGRVSTPLPTFSTLAIVASGFSLTYFTSYDLVCYCLKGIFKLLLKFLQLFVFIVKQNIIFFLLREEGFPPPFTLLLTPCCLDCLSLRTFLCAFPTI